MAIDFPDSPSVNDTHTVSNRTWQWNGTYWSIVVSNASGTVATTDYVDSTVETGVRWNEAVDLATAAVLPNSPTYDNGSSGVGATLTAGSNARIVVDGVNGTAGDRVLVKNQAAAAQNGIYTVTTQGDGSTAYVLTRATDNDTSLYAGDATWVLGGSDNANQGFILTSEGTGTGEVHTLGSDSLTYTQFSGVSSVTAGTNLSKTGNTINLDASLTGLSAVTSTAFTGDLTGDVTGNLTGNVTGDVTGNVTGNLTGNVTGDVTGDLTGNVTGNVTGDVTGTADVATSVTVTANNTTNETVYVAFVDGDTGTQGIETDTGLTYNPSTGVIGTTSVTGNLTGNVTGNVTGDVTGDLTGNVTGNVTGNITGNVTGDVTGAVTGNVTGNLTGDVTGDLNGDVTGNVTGNVTGDLTGDVYASNGTSKILENGADGTDAQLTGSVVGDVTGDVTGNVTSSGTSTFSGTVNLNGATVSNAAFNLTGDLTGTADTATVATNVTATANNSTDETVYLTFVDGATGSQGIETDTGLSYNPSTGVLTTTSVTGNLTGDVTSGNIQVGVTGDNEIDTSSGNLTLDSAGGTVAIDDNATIAGDLTLTSTDAGSSAAPIIDLYRNSASPAAADYLGQIQYSGENSNGGTEIYAKVTGKITDPTHTSEDGLIETAIKGAGSFTIVSRQRHDELQLINGVGLSVAGDVTISGNLTVDGTTTTVNSTTITVDDKNIELGSVASPDDTTADGGGITLKGATDKTFNWVDATDSWTSSEHIDLASGKAFYINNTSVLSASALGTAVAVSLLSTTASSSEGRIAWDSTNDKIIVGDGSTQREFASSTLKTNARTASYTLVLADKDKLVEMGVGSANTLTVPPNSSVAYPVGTQITVLQTGAGQTTLTPGSGVTVNGTPGLKLRDQWSSATLIKRGTDTWVAVGDLSD